MQGRVAGFERRVFRNGAEIANTSDFEALTGELIGIVGHVANLLAHLGKLFAQGRSSSPAQSRRPSGRTRGTIASSGAAATNFHQLRRGDMRTLIQPKWRQLAVRNLQAYSAAKSKMEWKS